MRLLSNLLIFSLLFSSSSYAGVSFNGAASSGPFLSGGTNDDILTENGAFTLSVMVYVRSLPASVGAIVFRDNGSTAGVGIDFNSDVSSATGSGVRLFIRGGTLLQRQSLDNWIPYNTWHRLVITHDGSSTAANCHMYLDGVEASSYAVTSNGATPGDNSAQTTIIGNRSGGANTADAILDDIAVWNKVLANTEIVKLGTGSNFHRMPLQLVSSIGNLKRYWVLNDFNDNVQGNLTYLDRSPTNVTCTGSNRPINKASAISYP